MDCFDVKRPIEIVTLVFNMAAGIVAPATRLVGTPSINISVALGVDPGSGNVIAGPPSLDATGTLISVPVQGGILGCQYLIEVYCGTDYPFLFLAKQALLPVGGAP